MTVIKPAGQQKLFNEKSASANEIIPDRARVYSPHSFFQHNNWRETKTLDKLCRFPAFLSHDLTRL